jgi:hypothetical protein
MQKYVGWIFVRDDGGRKFYTTGSGDSTKAHGWDEQGLMAAVSFRGSRNTDRAGNTSCNART